ncbi:MAG: prepilin-type N-terminal cleavage/methylation domain-containing protein [Candidatus Saccharimonas sp.]
MTGTSKRQGFTLIELTLVMGLMSILLLAVLFLALHAGKLYTKGITNKALNQATREVTDTMKRDFMASDANILQIPALTGIGNQKSGRICTGSVSYVWNTTPLLNNTIASKITYKSRPVVFARVIDDGASLCAVPLTATIPEGLTVTELLSTNGRDYAVYSLVATKVSSDSTGRGLYTVEAVIGTNEPGTTVVDPATGFQCLPPAANTANFEYCTVAGFTTLLRAGGRGEQ